MDKQGINNCLCSFFFSGGGGVVKIHFLAVACEMQNVKKMLQFGEDPIERVQSRTTSKAPGPK